METPLVTIIIPVYNVEKYLDRCVDTIVRQTYRNLEIILVDDGSTDCSSELCDAWAKTDHRIRVIHKENAGQGIARNDAMKISTGEYVCFIDSDDYIENTAAIGSLVNAAEREQAEIVVFGLKKIAADGTVIARYVPQVGARTYRGREVQDKFLAEFISTDLNENGKRLFYMSSCLLLYSLKKIREIGWQYVSERKIISEDVYSLLNLFDRINTVTVVPEDYYCYCANDSTSFSRKYMPNRYEQIRHFYQETVKLCMRKKYSADVIKKVEGPYLAYTLAALKQEAKAPFSLKERIHKVYGILSDPVLQEVAQQKKGDWAVWSRKLVYFLIRRKWFFACFLLFAIKD